MPAVAADDYYALLGIDADATDDDVRRAWRRLALAWHPDRAGPEAKETFQQISVAYAVLSDPLARAVYDRGRGLPRRPRARTQPAAPEPAPRRKAPGVMLSRLSRTLDILLMTGIARRAEANVIELFLDEDEVEHGGMVTISMRVPVPCIVCAARGTGCTRCEARGTIEEVYAAWLAVPPGVLEGTMLKPSAFLPGMSPIAFRVRLPT